MMLSPTTLALSTTTTLWSVLVTWILPDRADATAASGDALRL